MKRQREALAAEGLTEDEIEDRIAGGGGGGAGVGEARPNALALLISVGARVEPATGASSDKEAIKKKEMQRTQRNINAFLSKTYDIEMKSKPTKSEDATSKGNKKNAYDVARDTKINPVGGPTAKRAINSVLQAKAARRVYRANKTKVDLEMANKMAILPSASDAALADDPNRPKRRENCRISEMSAAQLAASLEDEIEGEGGEEGEEGDEGEEGEEGDEEDLAA